MDIHSAKNSVNKLLAYIEGLSEEQPRMYAKSKERLKEIADNCNQVVAIISDILQEELLQEEESEEFSSGSVIAPILEDMECQISKVQQFNDSMADIPSSEVATPLDASANKTEQTALSLNVRKKVFAKYTSCLSQLPKSTLGYAFANRCAKLIWTWFETRFYITIPNSTFKYSMRKFPEWIQGIVVMYGKAIHDNNVAQFERDFRVWIDSIINTDARNRYVVPYPVYQFCKKHDPGDLTLDAVVLWDILLDCGLDTLCTNDKQDLYLDQYSVYNLCDSINSSVLENYADYANHPDIFETLRWEV